MIHLDRPLRLAEILDYPLQLIRSQYRTLIPLALIGSLASSVPQMIPQVMLLVGPTTEADFVLLVQLVNLVAALFTGVISLVAILALAHAGRGALEGNPLGIAEAFRRAVSPSTFGTLLLAAVLAYVGLCFCCVPGIVVSIYISLLAPLMVYEPPRGLEAIERAFRLAHYNPEPGLGSWTVTRIVLIWIVVMLVFYAVSMLVSLPFMGAAGFYVFKNAAEGGLVPGQAVPAEMTVATLIAQVLTSVIQGVTRLYSVIALIVLYLNVRNLREGRDLEREIDERLAGGPELP